MVADLRKLHNSELHNL